jgi:hypothetical protein
MCAADPSALDSGAGVSPPVHVTVSDLIRDAGAALRRQFPSAIWVKGEVSSYRPASSGHHYFDLVERPPNRAPVLLPCAIWKDDWHRLSQKLQNTGITLTSGQEMLFQGTVRLYDGAGKLTFHVSDVYTEFTLGQIEAQRLAVLVRLKRAAAMRPASGTSKKSWQRAGTPSSCSCGRYRFRVRWWSFRFAERWKCWL